MVAVLGSQVTKQGDRYALATHTELKARAAGVAWARGIAKRFIISGGYNWGVRYDDEQILPKPDFSFEAFARARRHGKSEAEVIGDYMKERCDVPEDAMLLEESSATTEENAEFLGIILKRPTFAEAKTVAILTLLHHMAKALPVFGTIMKVEPLFAEDLLTMDDHAWIDLICRYYGVPRDGKKWDVKKMRSLLTNGNSVGELLKA